MSSDWEFIDVPSLDSPILEVIEPRILSAAALVLIAPVQLLDAANFAYDLGSPVFFIRQTIENACGTIALLHILANLSSSHLNDHSTNSINNTASLIEEIQRQSSAEEKGATMEANPKLAEIHAKYSARGETDTPDLESDTDLHFVALIPQTTAAAFAANLTDWREASPSAVWLDGRKTAVMTIPTNATIIEDEGVNSFIKDSLSAISNLVSSEDSPNCGALAILALVRKE